MQLNLTYTFPSKIKTASFVLMGVGLLMTILAFVFDHGPEGAHGEYHHTHFWANILICAFFFMGIGLGATFYMALKYASEAHYTATFKRVYEAVSDWLWIAGPILVLVIFLGEIGVHHLYSWMDRAAIADPNSHHYDPKVLAKAGYFSQWFYWLRTAGFMFVWMWCQRLLRKRSLLEDQVGGVVNHFKNVKTSAIFLVFFGFTSSVAAWDWLMSLDVHWFSTMFGWYVFSGMWLSGMIAILVLVLYLKDNGYLEYVNESHIHDLGKWMFAISFLWSYLFFCQFMLIWYANIPEEVTYFQNRLETNGYKFMFWLIFFVNFALPMLFLMSRDAKRNRKFLMTIGFIIFIFHWLDIYMIVMPSTVGKNPGIGIFEIGPFLLFLGGFIYFVLGKLTKAPLLPVNHPYIEESKHHQI